MQEMKLRDCRAEQKLEHFLVFIFKKNKMIRFLNDKLPERNADLPPRSRVLCSGQEGVFVLCRSLWVRAWRGGPRVRSDHVSKPSAALLSLLCECNVAVNLTESSAVWVRGVLIYDHTQVLDYLLFYFEIKSK